MELVSLLQPNDTKIVLLVIDGLGGLPVEPHGQTALEYAITPNLDRLAGESILGLHQPVATGITSGSGPAHLALFGYDALKYQVGRGVLSALGIDFDLQKGDVAARGNFCTFDEDGLVTDRRAGRISTEENRRLLDSLRSIHVEGVEIFLEPIKEYRFLLVLRGEGLSGDVEDTDPQQTGVKPRDPRASSTAGEKTARVVAEFIKKAGESLLGQHPANMVLLRGFSTKPDWPQFSERFGLKAAALAAYPMYRGVARLVGMKSFAIGESLEELLDTLKSPWEHYDFFFLHVKKTDSYGEDGRFEKKMSLIQEVDDWLPGLLEMNPDVLIITGDHSTPAALKSHSWHPVPVMLWSKTCRPDRLTHFGERSCLKGGLGPRFPAADLMPLALAHAQRLKKFGA